MLELELLELVEEEVEDEVEEEVEELVELDEELPYEGSRIMSSVQALNAEVHSKRVIEAATKNQLPRGLRYLFNSSCFMIAP